MLVNNLDRHNLDMTPINVDLRERLDKCVTMTTATDEQTISIC